MYPKRTQQCIVSRCCSGASCVKRDLYIHHCVWKETYKYIQRAHNNVSYKEKLFETTQNRNKLYGFDVFLLCQKKKNVSYLKKLFGLGKLHLKIILECEHLRGRSLQRRHLLLQRHLRGGHLRLFNTHCIYVYSYTFVYVYLYTHYIYVYSYTYTYMYVYVNTYIYMYMYRYILIYQYICIHTCQPCQYTNGMCLNLPTHKRYLNLPTHKRDVSTHTCDLLIHKTEETRAPTPEKNRRVQETHQYTFETRQYPKIGGIQKGPINTHL